MILHQILEAASKLRIAVVGDQIIDRYILGTIDRISPEAPVPVLRMTQTKENRGGAGNVVENLRGLGVQVSEFFGKHVPVKTRVMSGNHHVIRIDDEEEPYWMKWDEVDIGLGYGIQHKKFDAVVISDYGKGMISEEVAKEIILKCQHHYAHQTPVIVDAKKDFHRFHGASVIKCNNKEASEIKPWKNNFAEQFDAGYFVVTDGPHGISAVTPYDNIYDAKGFEISICDTCGAGDTVTAVLAIMKCLYPSIQDAIDLANIAASEVCRHPGVMPINKELLTKRFNEVYHVS